MTPPNGRTRQRTPDILGELIPIPEAAQRQTAAQNARARKRRNRDRSWEKRNRAYSYRIDPEVHDAIKAIAAEANADPTFRTTIDLTAASLLDYAIAAYHRGDVEIYGHEVRPATRRTVRKRGAQ